jgi:hypothetical protein
MSVLRYEGNQLFLGPVEFLEWACQRESVPAHYQRIRCAGVSIGGKRVISADETGSLKIWDPAKGRLEKRVWNGRVDPKVTAVGVNDTGSRYASALGQTVIICDVGGRDEVSTQLEKVPLPKLQEPITSLMFTDDDTVVCHDHKGVACTIKRDPAWKIG